MPTDEGLVEQLDKMMAATAAIDISQLFNNTCASTYQPTDTLTLFCYLIAQNSN